MVAITLGICSWEIARLPAICLCGALFKIFFVSKILLTGMLDGMEWNLSMAGFHMVDGPLLLLNSTMTNWILTDAQLVLMQTGILRVLVVRIS